MNVKVEPSLGTRCRVCLDPSSGCISLCDTVKVREEDVLLYEILYKCCDIRVFADDNRPQVVCYQCSEDARRSYNFKITCQESEKVLLAELESTNGLVKTEDEPPDGTMPAIYEIESSDDDVDLKEDSLIDTSETVVKTENDFNTQHTLETEMEIPSQTTDVFQKHHESLKKKSVLHEIQCAACPFKSKSKVTLNKHTRNHLKNNVPAKTCYVCGIVFSAVGHMVNHLKSIHKIKVPQQNSVSIYGNKQVTDSESTENQIKCPKCDKMFQSATSVRMHHMRCHMIVPCEICGLVLSSMDGHLKHMKIHRNKSKVPTTVGTSHELPNDIAIEEELQPIEEELIEEESLVIKKESLNITPETREIVLNISNSTFNCPKCPFKTCAESSLKKHKTNHLTPNEKLRTCDVCTIVFKSRAGMLKHTRHTHKNEIALLKSDISSCYNKTTNRYECTKCNSFNTTIKQDFKNHYTNHIHKQTVINLEGKKNPCDDFLYPSALAHHRLQHRICEYCGASFDDQETFLDHRLTHIKHPVERPFKCEQCGKMFKSNANLCAHKRYHRSVNCKVCDKTLTSKEGLMKHMKIHRQEKNNKCTLCEKAFTEKQALQSHMYRHSEKKPYWCDLCQKGFYKKQSLKMHKLKMHSVD